MGIGIASKILIAGRRQRLPSMPGEFAPRRPSDLRGRLSPAVARFYFMVGMTNSAPLRIPVGQRLVTVFRWV